MNLAKEGKISSRQLIILLVGFLAGSTIVSSSSLGAGHAAWIAIIIGYALGLLLVLLFLILAARYPGQSLFEINTAVFGTWLGKVISLCYIGYFFHLTTLVIRNFADFFNSVAYPETPLLVLIVFGPLMAAYAVKHGLEVIAHSATLLLPFVYLIIVMTFFLLIPEMDFSSFLPVIDKPLRDILLAGLNNATFPFGESLVFLVLIPYLNKPQQIKSSYFFGFTFALFLLLLIAIRNIAVLGATVELFLYPSYEAVRMINIAKILTRVEVLVFGSLYFLGFIKTAVLYYATATGLGKVFNLQSYQTLIIPLGALLILVCKLQFENPLETLDFLPIYTFFSLFFQLFLPLLTLVVSLVRRNNPVKGVR